MIVHVRAAYNKSGPEQLALPHNETHALKLKVFVAGLRLADAQSPAMPLKCKRVQKHLQSELTQMVSLCLSES